MTDQEGLTEELKDLPLKDIKKEDIRDEDIVFGRGGFGNHHPGNQRYLVIVQEREMEYFMIENRAEKTEMALKMVLQFRREGSRFLQKQDDGDLWFDVGNLKMREKLSQRLRERMPDLKKRLAAEKQQKDEVFQKQLQQEYQYPTQVPSACAQFIQDQQQQQILYTQAHARQAQMQIQMQMKMQIAQIQNPQYFAQAQSMIPNYPLQQEQQNQQQQLGNPVGAIVGNIIPVHAGGVPIQAIDNDDDGMDPLPVSERPSWANYERDIEDILESEYNASPQRGFSSISDAPIDSGDLTDDDNSFHKRLSFSDRDHENVRSSFTLPGDGGPRSSFASPSGDALVFESRLSLDDIDVVEAMGGSNNSLLDYLKVDAVPEEDGDDDTEQPPGSPKPTQYTSGNIEEYTPPTSNRGFLSKNNMERMELPITVTPTSRSPNASPEKLSRSAFYSPLDDKTLEEWANGSEDIQTHRFAELDEHIGSLPLEEHQPARRRQTSPWSNSASSQRSPRKMNSHPGHSRRLSLQQTGSPRSASPKPPNLSMSKRQTSHQNETEETRHHLRYSDGPWGDFQGEIGSNPSSTWCPVKKASLGRDQSERARALKEQQFGASATDVFTASRDRSVSPVTPTDRTRVCASGPAGSFPPPLTCPSQNSESSNLTHLTPLTPRTSLVMHSLNTMNLSHNIGEAGPGKSGVVKTAQTFQDTISQG